MGVDNRLVKSRGTSVLETVQGYHIFTLAEVMA